MERRKLPFHLIAQDKGLSPVPRRAGTGKDWGHNTGKVLRLQHLSTITAVLCTQRARPEKRSPNPIYPWGSSSVPQARFSEVPSTAERGALPLLAVLAALGGGFHGIPWDGPHRPQGVPALLAGETSHHGGCSLQECWALSFSLWQSSALSLVKIMVLAAREKVLLSHCALRAVAPLPRKEGRGLHLHREGARHLHLWNSSGGELTDVNLLQVPNLLLALDLVVFFFSPPPLFCES